MTIGKVVDYFLEEYGKAIDSTFVQKPIAYALYKTWEWIDRQEKPRRKNEEG